MKVLRTPAGIGGLAFAAIVGGCMVGPNYKGPPEAGPKSTAAPRFVRATSAPVNNAAPPLAAWWEALGDPVLDALEQRALRASPLLDLAAARVRGARATLRQDQAMLLPTGGATASAIRARIPSGSSVTVPGSSTGAAAPPSQSASGGSSSDSSSSATYLSLYSVGVDATWTIDLFGGTRRQIAGARDQLEGAIAQFEDVQVMLTMEVATAYLNVRDNQNRLRIGEQRVETLKQIFELTLLQRRWGTADDSNVENARNQLATAESDNEPLRANVQVYADQLAAYMGDEPGTLDEVLVSAKLPPLPPAETSVGDPASLLRRRPDVRSAERTLAAENETIGQNIAAYFPSLELIGTLSFGSTNTTGGLFQKKNLSFIAGPSLKWNFLDIPSTAAKVEGARANYQLAEAFYRTTVLNALRDAENGLSQFGYQRRTVLDSSDATIATKRTADVYLRRYTLGTASRIDWLNQQSTYLQNAQTLAQNEAKLTSYWISLQSKLGLGWGVPIDGPTPSLPVLDVPTAASAPHLP